MGTRFIATKEAAATEANKQCIIDSSGEEIVYTNLFTGVHGNYLKRSIAAAGLDPDALPEACRHRLAGQQNRPRRDRPGAANDPSQGERGPARTAVDDSQPL